MVRNSDWRNEIRTKHRIAQGYVTTDPDKTIRVRIIDETARLTIKGRPTELVRREFEYEIPRDDARTLLDEFCGDRIVEKTRYEVDIGDHVWEIDEFEGPNEGLVVAEVELDDADESFERPDWIGEEVTGEVRYYNARLAESPYADWND